MKWKNLNDFLNWWKGGSWSGPIYDLKNVDKGFFYWYNYLKDVVYDLIIIESCPDSLPQKEILHQLITLGYATIIKHPIFGIITTYSSLYDYDVYGHYLKAVVYNQSRLFYEGFTPTPYTINKDCSVIYIGDNESYINNPGGNINKLNQLICRYARLLSDIESSIDNYIIYSRRPYIFTAKNSQIKEALVALFRGIEKGKTDVLVDDDIIGDSKSLKNIDLNSGILTELLDARDKILKQFLQQMGIYSTDDKEERLIVAEVEQENRNVKPFIYSLLKSIEEGLENTNAVFNTNMTCHLNYIIYNTDDNSNEKTEQIDDEEIIDEEEVTDEKDIQ